MRTASGQPARGQRRPNCDPGMRGTVRRALAVRCGGSSCCSWWIERERRDSKRLPGRGGGLQCVGSIGSVYLKRVNRSHSRSLEQSQNIAVTNLRTSELKRGSHLGQGIDLPRRETPSTSIAQGKGKRALFCPALELSGESF